MIKELKYVTDLDTDVIERYNGAERGREAWLQDEGRTNEPRVDTVHPWLSYRTAVDELEQALEEGGGKACCNKKTAAFVSVFKAEQSGSVASASKFTESTGDCYTGGKSGHRTFECTKNTPAAPVTTSAKAGALAVAGVKEVGGKKATTVCLTSTCCSKHGIESENPDK
jgi:Tfp pilus assembly major pilin PilA